MSPFRRGLSVLSVLPLLPRPDSFPDRNHRERSETQRGRCPGLPLPPPGPRRFLLRHLPDPLPSNSAASQHSRPLVRQRLEQTRTLREPPGQGPLTELASADRTMQRTNGARVHSWRHDEPASHGRRCAAAAGSADPGRAGPGQAAALRGTGGPGAPAWSSGFPSTGRSRGTTGPPREHISAPLTSQPRTVRWPKRARWHPLCHRHRGGDTPPSARHRGEQAQRARGGSVG